MTEGLSLGEILEQAFGAAIDAAVGEHERGLVVKWVALVETISPEGEQGVWTMSSPGATPWDSMGLLQYGMAIEKRGLLFADDEEEDE